LIAGYSYEHELVVARRTGESLAPAAVVAKLPEGIGRLLHAAELDGHGPSELVFRGRKNGRLTVYRVEGGKVAKLWDIGDDRTVVHFDDFNGDGRTDAVIGTDSSLSVRLNDGKGLGEPIEATWPFEIGARLFASADLDADGDIDLVAASGDFDVNIYLNEGGALHHRASISLDVHDAALAAADFDGDGRAEIALIFVSPGHPKFDQHTPQRESARRSQAWERVVATHVQLFSWTGSSLDKKLSRTFARVGLHHVDAGDVDGDGRTDLTLFGTALAGNEHQIFITLRASASVPCEPDVWEVTPKLERDDQAAP
jgi:hypothetical protein